MSDKNWNVKKLVLGIYANVCNLVTNDDYGALKLKKFHNVEITENIFQSIDGDVYTIVITITDKGDLS